MELEPEWERARRELNPKGGGPKIAKDSDGFFVRALTVINKEKACYF